MRHLRGTGRHRDRRRAGASAAATRSSSPARAPGSSSTTSAPSSTARGGSTGPAGEVVDEIRAAGGEAVVNGDDVADWDGRRSAWCSTAVDAFGRLDVVVNNAGVVRDRMFVNATEDEWDAVDAGPPQGPLRRGPLRRRALARPGQGGRAGRRPHRQHDRRAPGSWAASARPPTPRPRRGIAALTLVQAAELGRYGVTANAIAPSARTRMTEGVFADMMAAPDDADAFDAMAPENVVAARRVARLGRQSADVTGRVFEVEGGKVVGGRRLAARHGGRQGRPLGPRRARRRSSTSCSPRRPPPAPVYGAQ